MLVAAVGWLAVFCLVVGVSGASAAVIADNITFPSGSNLLGVSSDGTHVWVMNYNDQTGDDTVDEIDAATGSIVDTIANGNGNDAGGVSSDGTHVWVSNWPDNTVLEIDAATGGVINTISTGSSGDGNDYPSAISSDGTDVWVALMSGMVMEIDASTGAVVRTITVQLNNGVEGISSDGTHVWVANYNQDTVSEIDAATGAVVGNPIPVGDQPSAISSDGTDVWVTNAGDGTVNEIDAATGDVINTITVGANPHGVSADGTDVWVTNLNSGTVSEIDAATGDVINTIPVGGDGANGPFYVSSDGNDVWVANGGTGVGYEATVSEIPIVSAPDILATPDDPTRSTSATFEFSSDKDGAQFECSLDDSAFSACSSPQTYSDLADGDHTFQVEEASDGQAPGPASEFDWSVYTHPPTVLISSAPSGTTTSQTATIVFSGTAEDPHNNTLAFTCSLDGAAAVPCSSPDMLTDLAPGPHTFSVSAVDDVGNVSAPVTASWTLGSGTLPPPTACVAPLTSVAGSGLLVMVGRDGTCLKGAGKTPYGLIYSASGSVTLDGVTVIPAPGSTLTLTPSKTGSVFSSTGGVQVQFGSLPSFAINGPIKWTAPVGTSGLLSTGNAPWTPSIGGLHAVVNLSALDLSPDNGGSLKMTITVQLPFSALPGAAPPGGPNTPGGVSADLTLIASNANGVDFSGQLDVPSMYIGTTQIKDLSLGYDFASGLFVGSATILPIPDKGPNITASITLGPQSSESVFGCCVRKLELTVQDINKEIPDTPLFLQTIGGSASGKTTGGVTYPVFAGNVALTLGPQIGQTPAAVRFDGRLELDLSPPWTLTATGAATIESFPLADATVTYTEGGSIQLKGSVTATIRGYGFSAAIGSGTFFQVGGNYNIDATGSVTLGSLGSAQGEVVFSNNGFAACTTVTALGHPYAIGWGELANGAQRVFASTCDMGPYTSTMNAALDRRARADASNIPLTLALRAHSGPRLLAVHGASAAPQVTLTGPGGLSIAATDGASRTATGLVVPDQATDTTYLVLNRSPAGTYALTAANTAITSVSVASSLPPVSVKVQTRALRNGRRRLTYSQQTAPGQHLELFEQGSRGNDRLLLSTTRAHGQLIYTPRVGLGATRTIRAITVANSLPRATQTLAPYRVNDSPPARVRSLSRHGHRLRWKKTPRAMRYMLAFTTTNGATPIVTTRSRTVRIPANAAAATIVAIDAANRPGPATTIKLRGRVAHRHKPK